MSGTLRLVWIVCVPIVRRLQICKVLTVKIAMAIIGVGARKMISGIKCTTKISYVSRNKLTYGVSLIMCQLPLNDHCSENDSVLNPLSRLPKINSRWCELVAFGKRTFQGDHRHVEDECAQDYEQADHSDRELRVACPQLKGS